MSERQLRDDIEYYSRRIASLKRAIELGTNKQVNNQLEKEMKELQTRLDKAKKALNKLGNGNA
jgi:predicted  nucleic acid-binding Zn-ribbon protein